ncbi:hypothetical protein AGMMS49942_21360 [Spirochaetia bacterium]|nr:hypothetical protein AGMMS49942_21360 [Spirochaetia bacterium]
MKRKIEILILGALFAANLHGLAGDALASGHSGTVSAVAYDPAKNYVLSAGVDGFLGIWDVSNKAAVDRFQVSPYPVQRMSLRPGKTQVALVESDGVGVYRISAWDYERKQNLFTLRLEDPVTFITYSAAGNFLMVTRKDRIGVIFIRSESGELLDSPPALSGAITFAATGKSERTMMTYAVSGHITYWELSTGMAIQNSPAPINLESPALFGNNRYLCGIDSRGLVVVDAVTGKEIARDQNAGRGALFPVAGSDLLEFMYLGSLTGSNAGTVSLVHYIITAQGTLESVNTALSFLPLISGGVSAGAGAIALGTVDGGIWLLAADDTNPQAMHRLTLTHHIRSAAVSGNSLALITEDTVGPRMSIIPMDYLLLKDGTAITLEDSGNNTRISGDPGVTPGSPGRFLLWQTNNTRSPPVLLSGNTVPLKLPLRHPLRSASLLGNQALFLDSGGTITLVSTDSGAGTFTYTAANTLDVSFYDSRNIIIGLAAPTKTAPFLLVNTVTQETTPFIYPAAVGVALYRAPNGMIYGGVVDGTPSVTTLLLLNIQRPSASKRLLEYPGEDTAFIVAQSGLSLAVAIGGNGPALHSSRGSIPFERSPSLPENLIGSDKYFIVLGKDGSLSWHSPVNGSLLARLQLLEKEWILDTADGPSAARGPVNRN